MRNVLLGILIVFTTFAALAEDVSFIKTNSRAMIAIEKTATGDQSFLLQLKPFPHALTCGDKLPACSEIKVFDWTTILLDKGANDVAVLNPELSKSSNLPVRICMVNSYYHQFINLVSEDCTFSVNTIAGKNRELKVISSSVQKSHVVKTTKDEEDHQKQTLKKVYDQLQCDAAITHFECTGGI